MEVISFPSLSVPMGSCQGYVLSGFFQGSQVHEDFVFDTSGGEGRQLGPLPAGTLDGFDQTDGADGDQVLEIFSGVIELFHDMGDQPEIVLDEHIAGMDVAFCHPLEMLPSSSFAQRLGKRIVFDIGDKKRQLFEK